MNGGSDESLYCHAIPDARHICKAIQAEEEHTIVNSRVNLDYWDLAYTYSAQMSGFVRIESDKRMEQVIDAIKIFHKTNLTNSEFKRICPPIQHSGKVVEHDLAI